MIRSKAVRHMQGAVHSTACVRTWLSLTAAVVAWLNTI